jgi:hypothetical protein
MKPDVLYLKAMGQESGQGCIQPALESVRLALRHHVWSQPQAFFPIIEINLVNGFHVAIRYGLEHDIVIRRGPL